jgi:hypothetical protein
MKTIRGEINGLSLLVLHSEGGESALGYHSLAQEFLEAAEKLVGQPFLPAAGTAESFLAGTWVRTLLEELPSCSRSSR